MDSDSVNPKASMKVVSSAYLKALYSAHPRVGVRVNRKAHWMAPNLVLLKALTKARWTAEVRAELIKTAVNSAQRLGL